VKPSLLFLSQHLPFPPNSGGKTRTYNVLKQLQKGFEVTLLPFTRRNHQDNTSAITAAKDGLARELTRVGEPQPIRGEWSIGRKVRDHLLSTVSGKPYTYYTYEDDKYRQQLEWALEKETPALVHLDCIDLARFIPLLPNVPITCTHHDIESGLLARKAESARPRMLRPYIRHQARLVRRQEEDLTPRVDLNLMMSPLDADRLRQIAPSARTAVVPNGVDTGFFDPSATSGGEVEGRVVFIGPTYVFANRDAVGFLLETIWPQVRRSYPDATLRLLGRNPPEQQARYESMEGMVGAGYVDDMRPHLRQAACSVVPIRIGGGTRIKILESWAMGIPVVSTTLGCEGLEAVDGKNILIRDEPKAFAEAVAGVLADETLRRRLGREGRRTVEGFYSWDRIGERLRNTYMNLIQPGHTAEIADAV